MYDIIGIGQALIDLCIEVDEELIEKTGLNPGQMNIVSPEKFKEIHSLLKKENIKIDFGGSVSNTIDGLSLLGCKVAEHGKVGRDEYGEMIIKDKDNKKIGNFFSKAESPTGNVIALITPDAQRTFAVCLGASSELSAEDIDEELIKQAKIIHFTGYEFESPKVRSAIRKAADIAKENNILISMDLADPGVVQRNYIDLKEFIKHYVDILLANEEEAEEMTGKPPMEALEPLSELAQHTVIVKIGEKGSLIRNSGNTYTIPAYKVDAQDTTGAGDMYCAGILYGIINNLPWKKAGKIASFAASKVVESKGARLKELDISKIK